jgi:hypothetical protein
MNGSNHVDCCERSPRPDSNYRERLIPRDPKGLETLPSECAPGELSVFEFLQEDPPASSVAAPAHTEKLPPTNFPLSSTTTNYPPRTSSLPTGAISLKIERTSSLADIGKENIPVAVLNGGEKNVQGKGSQKSLRDSVSRFFKFHRKGENAGKP